MRPPISSVWGEGWGEMWSFPLFEHDETRVFASRQQDAADLTVSCWELSDRGSHQQRPALVYRDACIARVFTMLVCVSSHTGSLCFSVNEAANCKWVIWKYLHCLKVLHCCAFFFAERQREREIYIPSSVKVTLPAQSDHLQAET